MISRVVMPEDSVLTTHQYLQSLDADAEVRVVAQKSMHGLSGKIGNRSNFEARLKFREFILQNRAPSVRTAFDGRTHGAEFYMDARFTCVRFTPASIKSTAHAARLQAERAEAAADAGGSQASSSLRDWVLADVFRAVLPIRYPKIQVPSAGTVDTWWRADYACPSSEYGYTSLFPVKTDACSFCSEEQMEIEKLRRSLARHLQQRQDLGSIPRQQAITELRQRLD